MTELDFDAINRFLNGDDEPDIRSLADQAIQNVHNAIEAEAAMPWWTQKAEPVAESEALKVTGYRATDATGMSLERNGAQVSTRTVPQAKRQSDGGWTCVMILLGIAATILGLAACRLADWISLVGV